MKTPDPASEPLRAPEKLPAEPGPRRSEEREEEEFRPKYLSVPVKRSRGHGWRNLVWGIILLLVAGLLLAVAFKLAGAPAMFTVAVGLATAGTLHIIGRSRLLRQRNGDFLAGAIVCVVAVCAVLAQQAWKRLMAEPTPASTAEEKKAAEEKPATAAARPGAPLPVLIEKYPLVPDQVQGLPRAVVERPTTVMFENQRWQLRKGDTFGVGSYGAGRVSLVVGEEEVFVDGNMVKVTSANGAVLDTNAAPGGVAANDEPAADANEPGATAGQPSARAPGRGPAAPADTATDPADYPAMGTPEYVRQYTAAMKEATRLYPALKDKDSLENQVFRENFNDIRMGGAEGVEFQADPAWPLRLVNMLAKRFNWARADGTRMGPPRTARPPAPAAPAAEPEDPGAPAPLGNEPVVGRRRPAVPADAAEPPLPRSQPPAAPSGREVAEP